MVRKNIIIKNIQRFARMNSVLLQKVISFVLDKEKIKDKELTLLLVDDQYIKKVNKRYLRRTTVTDVISFEYDNVVGDVVLGDVIVSVERALHQSKRYRKEFSEEVCLYIIHGILHLTGYDDTSKVKASRMKKREAELIELIKELHGEDVFDKIARLLIEK